MPKKKPAVQAGLTHMQFYVWCKQRRACRSGLSYLRRHRLTSDQFWKKCSVPEYRWWLLTRQGSYSVKRSMALLKACGLRSVLRDHNVKFNCDRKAANIYLKKRYKCPVLKPLTRKVL